MQSFIPILLLVLTNVVLSNAQNLIWNEDFNAAMSTLEWETVNEDNGVDDLNWKWDNDPCDVRFGFQPCFGATSADSGFMFFNSFANGNNPHDVSLSYILPIDCGGYSNVYLKFQNQYAFISGTDNSKAFVGISTNGIDYTFKQVLQEVENNDIGDDLDIVIIDITDEAANQDSVYLKFRWQGQYEWAWKIDDIELWDDDPTYDNDLTVMDNFYAIAPNIQTPASQVAPMNFLADVKNNGQQTQNDLHITISIKNLETEEIAFADTLFLGSIAPGQIIENIPFEKAFLPPPFPAFYEGTYRASSENEEQFPEDNTISFRFEITQFTFSKDIQDMNFPLPLTSPTTFSWSYGNHYYLPAGAGQRLCSIYFEYSAPSPVLNGEEITFYLYEWEDVNDDGIAQSEERGVNPAVGGKIVASEVIKIKPPFSLQNPTSVEVPLLNYDNPDDPVFLKDDTHYLLMAQISTNEPATIFPWGTAWPFIDYSATWFVDSLKNDDRFGAFIGFEGGLNTDFVQSFDAVPVLRMKVDSFCNIVATSSPSLHNIRVFPNPVKEDLFISIDGSTELPIEALQLYNVSGQLVLERTILDFQSRNEQISLSGLSAGLYFLEVRTATSRQVYKIIKH